MPHQPTARRPIAKPGAGFARFAAFAMLASVLAMHPANAEEDAAQAVRSVLGAYHAAIESRDVSRTPALFDPQAVIVEQGRVEGLYQAYLDHHLGPEMAAVTSFDFDNYQAEVSVEGDVALATETYSYHIVLNDGRVIDRQGAATSTLRRAGGVWRIAQYHSSSRAPNPANP